MHIVRAIRRKSNELRQVVCYKRSLSRRSNISSITLDQYSERLARRDRQLVISGMMTSIALFSIELAIDIPLSTEGSFLPVMSSP